MRWFDYFAAIWFAFHIWLGVMFFDTLLIMASILGYILYERVQKWKLEN